MLKFCFFFILFLTSPFLHAQESARGVSLVALSEKNHEMILQIKRDHRLVSFYRCPISLQALNQTVNQAGQELTSLENCTNHSPEFEVIDEESSELFNFYFRAALAEKVGPQSLELEKVLLNGSNVLASLTSQRSVDYMTLMKIDLYFGPLSGAMVIRNSIYFGFKTYQSWNLKLSQFAFENLWKSQNKIESALVIENLWEAIFEASAKMNQT